MNIVLTPKALIESAPITLVYGEPGVGKSTWAADAPDVAFLALERGAEQLPVRRLRIGQRDPQTFEEVQAIVNHITNEKPEFGALAIDTVDGLERMIFDHVAKLAGKPSVADIGYGKGYDAGIGLLRQLMARFERLKDFGVHVIILAHAKLETFQNPEGADFNFWDLELNKRTSGTLVKWADCVLFARREQYALEEGGKVRGVGTSVRFLNTQKSPTFVAKNRYNLPDKLPLRWSEYAAALAAYKPADPAELLTAAKEILSRLPEEVRIKAQDALSKIGVTDAVALSKFVDFAKAKVMT
jgi:hypothetical protein